MSSRSTGTTRTGLGAIDSKRFDAIAAVGGWRGILESVVPTLMFVLVMAVRPAALVPALLASLAISAICFVARLVQRQSPAQVLGGVVLVLVSALWAWRSGEASNFYATGLMINAAWLVVCLVSLLIGWPIVGAPLTLPGIAGIVLTLGMAVDANVLIYERIREEVHEHIEIHQAVRMGFANALSTIVDANITTLIVAVLLFSFGAGPIKGFAVTLSLGILTTMFTAIFVTRALVEYFTLRKANPKINL